MDQKLNFVLRCATAAIKFYQHTASPDHGWLKPLFPAGVCRFEPTCSQYAIEALQKYHWGGVVMAAKRLLKCHPLHTGGYDPVIHNS